jgi:hypothetical protein
VRVSVSVPVVNCRMKAREFVRNQVLERRSLDELERALKDEEELCRPGVLRQIRQELLGRAEGRALADRAGRLSIERAAKDGDYAEIFASLEAVDAEVDEFAWSAGVLTTALIDGGLMELNSWFIRGGKRNPIVESAVMAFVVRNYLPVVTSTTVPAPAIAMLLEALREKSLERLKEQFQKCFRSEHRFKQI